MDEPIHEQEDPKWKSTVDPNMKLASNTAGPREYEKGDCVLMDVRDASGGRGPQTFTIEKHEKRGAAWLYQLKDASSKLHEGGRWFAEGDLSAPRSTR